MYAYVSQHLNNFSHFINTNHFVIESIENAVRARLPLSAEALFSFCVHRSLKFGQVNVMFENDWARARTSDCIRLHVRNYKIIRRWTFPIVGRILLFSLCVRFNSLSFLTLFLLANCWVSIGLLFPLQRCIASINRICLIPKWTNQIMRQTVWKRHTACSRRNNKNGGSMCNAIGWHNRWW